MMCPNGSCAWLASKVGRVAVGQGARDETIGWFSMHARIPQKTRLVVAVAFAAVVAVLALLVGCSTKATVDGGSPRAVSMSCAAGSDLTETSQYVEARIAFDAPLEASGDVAADLDVTLNGEVPDGKTIAIEASVDGDELVVRLVPAAGADGSNASVYFALYDGDVRIAAKSPDGGLAHVKAAGLSSNAVLDKACEFTAPSGMEISVTAAGGSDSAPAAVSEGAQGPWATIDFAQFAQLRCCTWFSMGDGLPIVMMHNHEFARDLPSTAAQRFADTVNANYGDALVAVVDGSSVTVRAIDASAGSLDPRVCEGFGALPAQGEPGDGALEVSLK